MQPTTLCNMDCSYCYLPHRRHHRIMSVDVARATAQAVESWARRRPVDIVWHGGEPLTAGRARLGMLMDCFPDCGITHSIQTNATLIDQRWCRFFTERSVRVGISLDGAECDNTARTDCHGQPMFDRVVRGLRLLIDSGHDVAVIAVVSDPTPERAQRLYTTVAELGCRWLGVNIEEREGVNQRSNQQPAQQLQEFWAALADVWHSDRRVRLRDIDRVLGYTTGVLDGPHSAEHPVPLDPLPTIAYDGSVTLISPELAGFRSDRLGEFHCGNVINE
ncbi:MAG: radical SAM protein, partial [Pseudonocardiaceae bacterium]